MRVLACLLGLVFGGTLCWTGLSDPDVIRDGLTFSSPYLFEFFAAAVLVAAAGLQVLRRTRGTDWLRERPQRRHVAGGVVFGLGWGVTGACPGPIATLLGQGILWALPLAAGVVLGVRLFLRQSTNDTEPATDVQPSSILAPPGTVAARGE
jgi:uncharacterized membrane protein YedE/YeeE